MRQLTITQSITNRDGLTVEKYFSEVSKIRLLTKEEETDLASRIRMGDTKALERLVKANLRFVVSVAKQYQHMSMPLNDLINEGNIGLIKAARMFDETKGFKFISYAVFWIRQSILQALSNHGRMVRLPVNKVQGLAKINQAAAVIEQQFEREPSNEELADFIGINVEEIKNVTEAALRHSSLDAPFGDEEEGSLLDVLGSQDFVASDEIVNNSDSLKVELERLFSVLSEREKQILSWHFGLGYDYSLSLDEIAENLGLTRERVRQIKEMALRKLRSKGGRRLLESYL